MLIRDGVFYLTKPEARALLGFTSADPEDIDPGRVGVTVYPKRGTVLARDYARMAVLAADDDATGSGAPFIVPRATFATALKACPAKGRIGLHHAEVTVWADGALPAEGDAEVADGEPAGGIDAIATLPFVGVSAEPPDYDAAIPGKHGGHILAVGLDPELLGALALVGKAAGGEGVLFVPADSGTGVLFEVGEWRVVIAQRVSDASEDARREAAE